MGGQDIGLPTVMLRPIHMGMVLNKLMVNLNAQHAIVPSQLGSDVWFMKGRVTNKLPVHVIANPL